MAFTTIDDPSAHFQTVLWTGNGSTQSITFDGNSNLQPDFLWTKCRSDTFDPIMRDTSRGIANRLLVHATDAEGGATGTTAFNSDGFSLDSTNTVNNNTDTYAAWGWKANGGTTSSLSGGDIGITTTSQVNSTAKFSINTYTGTGSQSAIGHGLGVKPDLIIIKNRDQADGWFVWHKFLNNNQGLALQSTDAAATNNGYMGNEAPTTTTIGVGTGSNTNASGEKYVCYAWANVQGYSSFGKYNSADQGNGPFIYTGFRPACVIIKAHEDAGTNWRIYDNKRHGYNNNNDFFELNRNSAEATSSELDILSNGFKLVDAEGDANYNDMNLIYFAWAEHPFVTSSGVPTTAR